MFEKVNPRHPDKIADRIAGAIVDLAYRENKNPRIAVEVLIGHGKCHRRKLRVKRHEKPYLDGQGEHHGGAFGR